MKKFLSSFIAIGILTVLLFVSGAIYTVREDQQILLTQFGKPVGDPITEAGLHFKIPFIQKVNEMEKRVLSWDGNSSQMPTRDKLYIKVDTFARWEISKPLVYFQKLRDERTAQSRLDDVLGSETRNAVANNDLIEIIRTTKDRKPQQPEEIGEILGSTSALDPISKGRTVIEKAVFDAASGKLESYGIKLLDLRFKRVNYTSQDEPKMFLRMVSERRQIAERFRSEGAGEAARIVGDMEREVKTIESEAYQRVQSVLGKSDAEATRTYAEAYGGSPEQEEFYGFFKTLEAYDEILDENTTLILSTNSELFRLLNGKSSGE